MKTIGTIQSPFQEKFGIPRQPGLAPAVESVIVLEPELTESLRGLDGFSHLWVIFRFHAIREAEVGHTVRPPRLGGNRRVGVFASRSPFRPNPVGLSLVEIVQVDAARNRVVVRGTDMLDGTPVLDLKPYVPYADTPVAPVRTGWLEDAAPLPALRVDFTPEAAAAVRALEADVPRLAAVIRQVLALDPRPAFRADRPDDREHYGARLFDFDVRWRVRRGASGDRDPHGNRQGDGAADGEDVVEVFEIADLRSAR